MKYLLPVITLCSALFLLPAAEPAIHGNLLAALEETNPDARSNALLYALEHSGKASTSLLRVLDAELGSGRLEKSVLKRLTGVWRNRPEDLYTAEFVLARHIKNGTDRSEFLPLVRNSLKSVALTALSPAEKNIFYRILAFYDGILQQMLEFPAAAEFYDTLIAKYPGETQLAVMAAKLYVIGCFRDNDTAPGMKHWDAVPAKNIWKQRLLTMRCNGEKLMPADAGEAVIYPVLAIALNDRRMLDRALKVRQDVPVVNTPFDYSLPYFGALVKNPRWCENAPLELKPVLLAAAGDVAGAEKAVAEAPEAMRKELELAVLIYKRDFKKIQQIVNGGFMPQSREGRMALCNAAEKLRDAGMLKKFLAVLPPDAGKKSPVEANMAAYTCAVLNVELPPAEKFLRDALDAEPENYAFLDSMAWLLYQQKKYSAAREYIGNAVKHRTVDPAVSVLFLHAAAIELAATGDRIAAGNYLQRAEKLRTPEVFDYDEILAQKLQKVLQ